MGETLNPMLYPLDGFLGLQPSEPSFLDQRMMLFCRADNCRLAIRHLHTPATEERFDISTRLSPGMP